MSSPVRPEDYDVERMATIAEAAVTDDEQGRSPFDNTKVEYEHTDDEAVELSDPILVKLPPKPHLNTVVISATVPPLTPIVLVGQGLKRHRTLIQVITPYASGTPDTGVLYIGEQPSTATPNGGYRLTSAMQPLELWGSNVLYATASTATEVRCIVETEAC